MVVGSKAFIDDARANRKILGGMMRQVGVIAAAGLVALDEMIPRLADDHANARLLAERLAQLPDLEIDLASVQTNIVRFNYRGPEPERFVAALAARGLWITGNVLEGLRCVTHYGIEAADALRAADVVEAVVEELAGKRPVAVATT
jgi:threonine aldolase